VNRLAPSQGRYQEAEPLFRRALAIGKKVSGPEHDSVAVTMTNLAEMCHLSGRLPEAETLLRQVFVLLERIPGPEHPELALALNNLASQYQDHQRYSGGVSPE